MILLWHLYMLTFWQLIEWYYGNCIMLELILLQISHNILKGKDFHIDA